MSSKFFKKHKLFLKKISIEIFYFKFFQKKPIFKLNNKQRKKIMKIINKLNRHSKKVTTKVLSFFFLGSLLFFISCSDSPDIVQSTINPETKPVITADDFTTENNATRKEGYTDNEYGKVTLREGVSATFAIADSNVPNNGITIDLDGNITFSPDLEPGNYSFKLVATGIDEYEGSATIDLSLNIEEHTGSLIYNVNNIVPNSTVDAAFKRSNTELATAQIGDTTYFFATVERDNRLEAFKVTENSALESIYTIEDGGFSDDYELNGARGITTAKIGELTYIFVAGRYDHGISVFQLNNDDTLSQVSKIESSSKLELNGVQQLATAKVGANTYLFTGAYDGFNTDGVLSIYNIGSNGGLTLLDSVIDSAALQLNQISKITTAEVNGATYLFAAGRVDNGVSVFNVSDGKLNYITSINNADSDAYTIEAILGITTAEVNGTTYLFVSGAIDNSINKFTVGNDGVLTYVDSVVDNNELQIDGVQDITTTKVGDTTYLFGAGYDDGGVSMFSIADNGKLINVANIKDEDNSELLQLAGAMKITTGKVDDSTYLFAFGHADEGISLFKVTN